MTSKALEDIGAERQRQRTDEGWTVEHDDTHDTGELARAASVYALIAGCADGPERAVMDSSNRASSVPNCYTTYWPWSEDWLKPTNRRRDLVKAGALIVAEIERLDRAASKGNDQ